MKRHQLTARTSGSPPARHRRDPIIGTSFVRPSNSSRKTDTDAVVMIGEIEATLKGRRPLDTRTHDQTGHRLSRCFAPRTNEWGMGAIIMVKIRPKPRCWRWKPVWLSSDRWLKSDERNDI
jgi:hypothetical protein